MKIIAVIGTITISLSACTTAPGPTQTTRPPVTNPITADPPPTDGPIDPMTGEGTPSAAAQAYSEFAASLQRDPSAIPGVTSRSATSVRVTLDQSGRLTDITRFGVSIRRTVGESILRSRHVALIQSSDLDPLVVNLGTLFSTKIGEVWGEDGTVVIGSEQVPQDTAYITITAPDTFVNGTVIVFDRGEGAPRTPVSSNAIANLRSTAMRVITFPVSDERGEQ
ncbi:MAG: hypothetical protein AAFR21_18430 [Pseudomonadota bacterium]